MFKHLFAILFRPGRTLDTLLEERDLRRSRSTTWLLIGLNVLVLFVLAVFLLRFVDRNHEPYFYLEEELLAHQAMWVIFGGWIAAGFLQAVLALGLGRVVFSWIVRVGLQISAHRRYPSDPLMRKENARLLRLIHPYTAWLTQWPKMAAIMLAPLLLLLPGFAMFLNPEEPVNLAPEALTATFWVWIGLWVLLALVQLGMTIYLVIARTLAIQKIYGIGAGQAFWGPLLVYVILYFAAGIIYLFCVLLTHLLHGGGGPVEPGFAPDFSPHLGI
ncbi:hypothetical protein [Tumebacillus flagellatus]|uniref:Yip1 domain-containing protein n=1 Tax=Tumebacillus flagellatus TaxID=1157490 RepID=A0A074LTL1_9BACL|nr:hypothetical protein [Tumebacillus flagellatus]KEO83930.1 hypothetical protein EL26_07005 [Tumebacillus flagellatus]